ncbi:MAG: FmdB family zinc ribbon protein [Bacillota bacterium]
MPIFEYKCNECGKIFESLERQGELPGRKDCPHCGSSKLTRLLSRFSARSSGGTKIGGSSCSSCSGGSCSTCGT